MDKRISSILLAIAVSLCAAGPAAAQAPSLDDFQLRQTQLDLQSRVDALAGRRAEFRCAGTGAPKFSQSYSLHTATRASNAWRPSSRRTLCMRLSGTLSRPDADRGP
jgi:hypothetical protein